jgi:phosphate transport system permease protein
LPLQYKKNPADIIFSATTAVASFSVIIFIIGILFILISESSLAIEKFGILKFLSSTDWDPVKESFGALTNIYGTVITTFLSLIIAIPVAIGIAIFVTEIAPNFLKGPIGAAIELLAAIPSIIYGMWGIFTLSPIMSRYVEPFLKKSPLVCLLSAFSFRGHRWGLIF